jgi:hypothetical protein
LIPRRYVARYLRYFAGWLVLALVFTTIVAKGAFNYYRLSKSGVLTEGIAVARAPHDQIEFSFKADNRLYRGVGTAGVGTPPIGKISMGDGLSVYYLPEAPEINCLGSPRELLFNELPPLLLVAVLFPSIIVAAVAIRQRWKVVGYFEFCN